MDNETKFNRVGWAIGAAVLGWDLIMVNDLFLVQPGSHGIIATWHGAPWPLLLLLAVPVAHIWVLTWSWKSWSMKSAWNRRGIVHVAVLVLGLAVFHVLFWDNGVLVGRFRHHGPL